MHHSHPYVTWARICAAAAASGRPAPDEPPSEWPEPPDNWSGAFVSFHRPDGELRGCCGTFRRTQPSLADEIRQNARTSALRDPRFPPMSEAEVEAAECEVYVLQPEEPINGPEALDPRLYGVIVRDSMGRTGLLLPDLEGVDTVEQQISICRRKAGIRDSQPISLSRFKAQKYR